MAERTPAPNPAPIGPVRADEIAEVARLYIEAFPTRVARMVRSERASAFYNDFFEIERRTYPDSFFVARNGAAVTGFLLLTVPGRNPLSALRDLKFAARLAGRALAGRYGAPPGILRTFRTDAHHRRLEGSTHVEAIAVRPDARGGGIARRLMEHAHEYSASRNLDLWLRVERTNAPANRLYERLGLIASGHIGDDLVLEWKIRSAPSAPAETLPEDIARAHEEA